MAQAQTNWPSADGVPNGAFDAALSGGVAGGSGRKCSSDLVVNEVRRALYGHAHQFDFGTKRTFNADPCPLSGV